MLNNFRGMYKVEKKVVSILLSILMLLVSVIVTCPIQVQADPQVQPMVTAGKDSVHVLSGVGEVFSWGSNYYGQSGLGIGSGTIGSYDVPTLITALSNKSIVSLTTGGQSAYAVTSAGEVFSWGDNSSGQLGHGDRGAGTERIIPTQIIALNGKNVVSLTASEYSVYALTSTGEAYSWGRNTYGQLGLGAGADAYITVPTLITAFEGENIVSFAASEFLAYALTSAGDVYSWGFTNYGRVNHPDTINYPTPILVLEGKNITSIAAGHQSAYAFSSTGESYSWGYNNAGQLGHGDSGTIYTTPTKISALDNKNIISFAANYCSVYALTSIGEVYSWGLNYYGQLGHGTSGSGTNYTVPTLIEAFDNEDIVSFAAGQFSAYAVSSTGGVYSWGYNNAGQLGLGDNIDRHTPTLVSNFISYDTCTLTTNIRGSGSGTVDGGGVTVISGVRVTLVAFPSSDSVLEGWEENGTLTPLEPVYPMSLVYKTLPITTDTTYTAIFTRMSLDTPVNLLVTPLTSTSCKLSWDIVPFATSYKIYQDGSLISTSSKPYYIVNFLTIGVGYAYTVEALGVTEGGMLLISDQSNLVVTELAPIMRFKEFITIPKLELILVHPEGENYYEAGRKGVTCVKVKKAINFLDLILLGEDRIFYVDIV